MLKSNSIVILVVTLTLLGACNKPDPASQGGVLPRLTDVPSASRIAISPPPSTDYSLPANSSASVANSPDSLKGKSDPLGSMTKQEESTAMPLPRQANDHSSEVTKTPTK
ncbi:MAG: hypothetical protein WCC58_05345 [Burkholderiales bacterium]